MKTINKLNNVSYRGKVPLLMCEIRKCITDGTFTPGQRLPTRSQLSEYFGFSSLTIQRAMKELEEKGFIESRGRSGSFVSTSLPHLTRYAILFPYSREDHWWGHFYDVLESESVALNSEKYSFFSVYGFDTARGQNDYASLVRDVNDNRVAGLIFASSPIALLNTPLLDTPGLPRVAFMSEPLGDSVIAITMRPDEFMMRSLDYLEECGCKRPAVIVHSEINDEQWKFIQKLILSRGMTCPSRWIHGSRLDRKMWVEHIIRLMFSPSNSDRPDSIIIADDNLLGAVNDGLQAEHITVPDDITIVALANFPRPTVPEVPAKRFGVDIHDFLKTAVDLINKQRQGEKVPLKTYLPIIDDEM